MTPRQVISSLSANRLLSLAKRIAAKRAISLDDMWGDARPPAFAWARFEFWATAYTPHGVWSLTRLAAVTGRNHTTILNGIQRHNAMAKERPSAEENEVA